jgi:hypothetical protein
LSVRHFNGAILAGMQGYFWEACRTRVAHLLPEQQPPLHPASPSTLPLVPPKQILPEEEHFPEQPVGRERWWGVVGPRLS